MDLGFIFTIFCTIASGVWFLSKQLHELNISIDKIGDLLREYQIRNDNALLKERDRITALKINIKRELECLYSQIEDIEQFLAKHPDLKFKTRKFYQCQVDTFTEESNWSEIK